eukprot:TRINITY_DN10266_c0_g1_i1.p1 TRINITY_DN10266_c0_g1~~TRINITY_DN10266_c0_g1_i1.p1  ORF type:complete len:2015 (+),score=223.50 TRINITY_DN10266_c0_g1_i1:107-6046(+)
MEEDAHAEVSAAVSAQDTKPRSPTTQDEEAHYTPHVSPLHKACLRGDVAQARELLSVHPVNEPISLVPLDAPVSSENPRGFISVGIKEGKSFPVFYSKLNEISCLGSTSYGVNHLYSTTQVNSGRWFYEILPSGDKMFRVGWARHNAEENESFVWESQRGICGTSKPFGTPCKLGDVIGCGIDATIGSIYYWVNGKFLGTGFQKLKNSSGFLASIALEGGLHKCKMNFGGEPFKYPPAAVLVDPTNDNAPVDFLDWQPMQVRWLSELKAAVFEKVNPAHVFGWTPLHIAAFQGNTELCELLLTAGADVDTRDSYQRTPLIAAFMGSGNWSLAQTLLHRGAIVSAVDSWGRTALFYALSNRHNESVPSLYELSPESALKRETTWPLFPGDNCLHVAAKVGNIDFMQLLVRSIMLATAAGPHKSVSDIKLSVRKRVNILRCSWDVDRNTALYHAATHGHPACVRFLLSCADDMEKAVGRMSNEELKSLVLKPTMEPVLAELDAEILKTPNASGFIEMENDNGQTALHGASVRGHTECVEVLLQNGAQIIGNTSEPKNWTPLHSAAAGGNGQVMSLLVQQIKSGYGEEAALLDAETLGLDTPDSDNDTPLAIAASTDNVEAMLVLLRHGVNTNGYAKGKTPLYRAAFHGRAEAVKLLLSHGVDVDASCGSDDGTALIGAINGKQMDVAKLLITMGANVNVISRYDSAPFPLAAASNDAELIRLVLAHGGRNEVGKESSPLLRLMASKVEPVLAEELLASEITYQRPEEKRKSYVTPLHLLAVSGDVAGMKSLIPEILQAHEEVKKKLPKPVVTSVVAQMLETPEVVDPSPLDITTPDGLTPLHLACYANKIDCIQLLLENGSDIMAKDLQNYTPLMWASLKGHLAVVLTILEAGASYDGFNSEYAGKYGYTALTLAARGGHVECVKALLNNGSKISVGSLSKFSDQEDACFMLVLSKIPSAAFKSSAASSLLSTNYFLKHLNILLDRGVIPPYDALLNCAGAGLLQPIQRVLPLIVKHNVQPQEQPNPSPFTGKPKSVVQRAIEGGSLPVLRYLASEGFDPVANFHSDTDTAANRMPGNWDMQWPVHVAANSGKLEILRYLIEECNADANATDSQGRTALRYAATNGHTLCVDYLISKGADIMAVNNSRTYIIAETATRGHVKVLRVLLDRVPDRVAELTRRSIGGFSNTAVQDALNGRSSVALYLLNQLPFLTEHKTIIQAMLTTACSRGFYKVVEALIKRGADVNAGSGSNTALANALRSNSTALAELLITCGAEVDLQEPIRSPTGYTGAYSSQPVSLMHSAHRTGNLRMYNMLLQRGKTVEGKDQHGCTPLHESVSGGHLALLRRTVELGIPLDAKDARGRNLLVWAACNGKTLRSTQSPLHTLAVNRTPTEEPDVIFHKMFSTVRSDSWTFKFCHFDEWLKDDKANNAVTPSVSLCGFEFSLNVVKTVERTGEAIVAFEVKHKKLHPDLPECPVVNLCLSIPPAKGSKEREKKYNTRQKLGTRAPPGGFALGWSRPGTGPELLKYMDGRHRLPIMCKIEFDDAVDLSQHVAFMQRYHSPGDSSNYPSAKRVRMLEYLISCGLDVNEKSNDGWVPLHVVAEKSDSECVRILLGAGAEADAVDNNKSNAFHWMARCYPPTYWGQNTKRLRPHFSNCVVPLIAAGCPINGRDIWGATPLHYACLATQNVVIADMLVRLFVKCGAQLDIPTSLENGLMTPLHVAAKSGRLEAVKLLTRKGASVTASDYLGLCPIHYLVNDKVIRPKLDEDKTPGEPLDVALLADPTKTDITFKVGDTLISANKETLSTRSEYFNAMFMSQWAEADKNSIEINDVAPEIFDILIKYLWTKSVTEALDQCPNPMELALQLIAAADQFLLPNMLFCVIHYLSQHLTHSNIGDVLKIAEACDNRGLVDACLAYVIMELLKRNKAVAASEKGEPSTSESATPLTSQMLEAICQFMYDLVSGKLKYPMAGLSFPVDI